MALPELLAPAGSFDAAVAAFRSGADAVYLGLPAFSARAEAENFEPERLRDLLAFARALPRPGRVYVTVNTLVHERERGALLDALETLEELAPDALIVQDLGVARLVRRHFPSLALHASTQMAAHSVEGVRELRDLGFMRVVLARECTLEEVGEIVRRGGAEVEIFVHGALCYSVSGLCLYSALTQGRSGNRGRCAYCCRLGHGGAFPFSMRDLALAPVLDRLVATGAASLKIEGRMKGPLYVACVTEYYRKLLDGALSPEAERALREDLRSVFSREWTTLYAEGEDAPPSSVLDPESLGHRGAPIGRAERVSPPDARGVRWLSFRSVRALERRDGLLLKVPAFLRANDGHPYGFSVGDLRLAGSRERRFETPAGAHVEVALPPDAPAIAAGETVYVSSSQAVRRRHAPRPVEIDATATGRAARFRVSLAPDGVRVVARDAALSDVLAEAFASATLSSARSPERTAAAVRAAFGKLGGTAWRLADSATGAVVDVEDPDGLFAPASLLNEARRAAVVALDGAWGARRAARRVRLDAAPSPAEPVAAPARTLKFRIGQEPPRALPAGTDRIVLAIGHEPLDRIRERLAVWCEAGVARPALALPVFTRNRQATALEAALDALLADGFRDWEAADLQGLRRLRARGLRGFTVDGFVPAANREALTELLGLGAARIVTSAETPADAVLDLARLFPGRVEQLVRQSAPLFLSVTEPCGGGAGPVRRFDGAPPVVSHRADGLWATVSARPWRAAPLPGLPVREDYSWDPPEV